MSPTKKANGVKTTAKRSPSKFQCNGTGCMLPHGTVTCMKRATGR